MSTFDIKQKNLIIDLLEGCFADNDPSDESLRIIYLIPESYDGMHAKDIIRDTEELTELGCNVYVWDLSDNSMRLPMPGLIILLFRIEVSQELDLLYLLLSLTEALECFEHTAELLIRFLFDPFLCC